MKKIILTIIVIVLTILNVVLFRNYYNRKMDITESEKVEINL